MFVSGDASPAPLAHAARLAQRYSRPWTDAGDWALLLVDRHGTIHFSSESASAIMTLASSTRAQSGRFDRRRLPAFLLPTVEHAWKYSLGCADKSVTFILANSWGQFHFHAGVLQAGVDAPAALIAVQVYRLEPLQLRISRGARLAGLSHRQLLVCRHLANGKSYAEIAAIMSVRQSTVIDHVRKLYVKLDVHNHEQLWATLLTYGAATGGVSRASCST